MRENLTIGFIGNPNCGKTTLFNAYTGANLKVANWPGVTVEKVEGAIKDHDLNIRLVDLPGTYSLTSYTMEEQVQFARNPAVQGGCCSRPCSSWLWPGLLLLWFIVLDFCCEV